MIGQMAHYAHLLLLWAVVVGLVAAPFALMLLPTACGVVPDRTPATRKDH